MYPSTILRAFVLSFLPSLLVARIFSSLDGSFTLISRHPAGAHVVVNGDGTPVVTFDRRQSSEFTLKDGVLTTRRSNLNAILGPVNLPLPPPLIPLLFKKASQHEASFVAANRTDQSKKPYLRLLTLGERKLLGQIPLKRVVHFSRRD